MAMRQGFRPSGIKTVVMFGFFIVNNMEIRVRDSNFKRCFNFEQVWRNLVNSF